MGYTLPVTSRAAEAPVEQVPSGEYQLIMPAIPFEKRDGSIPLRCQYWNRQVLPLHRVPPMLGTPPPGAEAAFRRSML